MNRRRFLALGPRVAAGLAAGLAPGCSILPSRPYLNRRDWPLAVRRPVELPPPPGGKTLLVRTLSAAPGLDVRGLQTLQPDGSIQTAFYEEWNVPPAEGVEDDVRRWLAASGLFAAVLAPGSRANADLALEGEVQTLLAIPARRISRASMGLTLVDLTPSPARVLLQTELAGEAPLAGQAPEQVAQSGQAAVAALMGDMERRVSRAVSPALGFSVRTRPLPRR